MSKQYVLKKRSRYYGRATVEVDGKVEHVPGYSVYNMKSGHFHSDKPLPYADAAVLRDRLNRQAEQYEAERAERNAKETARLANMTEAQRDLETTNTKLEAARYILSHLVDDFFADAEGLTEGLEYFAGLIRRDITYMKEQRETAQFSTSRSPLSLTNRIMERLRHTNQAVNPERLLNYVMRINDAQESVQETLEEVADAINAVELETAEAEAAEAARVAEGMSLVERVNAAVDAMRDATPDERREMFLASFN